LPLDRQWIYASNKLLNPVDGMRQEWKSQETHLLAVVSGCFELLEALSNCPGMSAFQQIEFTDRIDFPDLPPN
jgi:hypothetical protein